MPFNILVRQLSASFKQYYCKLSENCLKTVPELADVLISPGNGVLNLGHPKLTNVLIDLMGRYSEFGRGYHDFNEI